jgi:Zn-dependent protease
VASYFIDGLAGFAKLDPLPAWIAASITTFLLFISIVGHELAHAVIAKSENIGTTEILLHPFGGLSRLDREPETSREEFNIAIAGPAASFLIAVACFTVMMIAASLQSWGIASIFKFAAYWNLILSLFNLLPGYPLDGGRVLRAALWRRSGRLAEATKTSGHFGQFIALSLLVFGLYISISWQGAFFSGLWTVLVGVYLFLAATSVLRESGSRPPKTVKEAMQPPVSLRPDDSVSHLIDRVLPIYQASIFPVSQSNRFLGLLLLSDVRKLSREQWHQTRIRELLRPVNPSMFVSESTPLQEAIALMKQNGFGAVAVVNRAGEIVGFLRNTR